MENNLDQLFRNKLSDHQVTPSGDSWEKLHSQLSHARGARMQKRLAIAASVLLFMSVVGVAYYYLDIQKSVENPMVSEKVDLGAGNSDITETLPGPQVAFNEIKEVNDAEANISEKPIAQNPDPGQVEKHSESIQSDTELPEVNSNTFTENSDESPLLAEITSEIPANTASATVEYQPEPTTVNALAETQSTAEPLTVTITYKANKNSKLVASQKGNVIQEGIEKITGFAEERVFTDELKTKLRNTTGDVLALNFGKLINKPNKEN